MKYTELFVYQLAELVWWKLSTIGFPSIKLIFKKEPCLRDIQYLGFPKKHCGKRCASKVLCVQCNYTLICGASLELFHFSCKNQNQKGIQKISFFYNKTNSRTITIYNSALQRAGINNFEWSGLIFAAGDEFHDQQL